MIRHAAAVRRSRGGPGFSASAGGAHRAGTAARARAMNASISAAGRAPLSRATSLPPAKTASVGIERMPKRWPRIRQLVGVHLHDDRLSGLARRHFLQLGRDHAARPAPRRPVVDDDRQRRRRDQPIEVGRVMDLDRLSGRAERLLALAALHRVAQPLVREPVLLAARLARDDDAAIVQFQCVPMPFRFRPDRPSGARFGAWAWLTSTLWAPPAPCPMQSHRRAARR